LVKNILQKKRRREKSSNKKTHQQTPPHKKKPPPFGKPGRTVLMQLKKKKDLKNPIGGKEKEPKGGP